MVTFPIFHSVPKCHTGVCVHVRELPEKWDPAKCPLAIWVMSVIVAPLWCLFSVVAVNRNSPCSGVSPLFNDSSVVMPQIASFHDSAHLWYPNDKSWKIQIYGTWPRVLKRHSKPNVLSENRFPKCLPGKNVKDAKPRGHGEWFLFAFSTQNRLFWVMCVSVAAHDRTCVYTGYVLSSATDVPKPIKNSFGLMFPCFLHINLRALRWVILGSERVLR